MYVFAGFPRFALMLVAAIGVAFLPLTAAREPAPHPVIPGAIDLQDGDTFVFLGDSITHQRLYTQYVETFFYTRFPDRRIRFHNAGVGGAQAWDALQRLQEDVTDFKPKYVSILLGMNDGRYRPFDSDIFATYQQDMTTVVDQLQAAGVLPILMSPTMFDARADSLRKRNRATEARTEYNSVLAYYGRWLQHQATEAGLAYVDMYGPLNRITLNQRKKNADFTMIRDAVHPDPPGQLVMALAMIEQLGAGKPLSRIVIRTAGKRGPNVRATGGEVTELKQADGQIEFDWTANGLPWVLPEAAQQGMKMTRAARRVSLETLRVVGLKPGQYEILIDGEVIAKRTADQMAQRVELQSNAKTAQYQQALAVAELNQQKNGGPVNDLRNAWRDFQIYARVKRDAVKQPDNEELTTRLAKLEKQMEMHDERVATAQAEISEFEEKIYAANKPQVRHFVIRKVKK